MILEKVYDELMAQIEDLKKAVAAMGGGGTDDYDDLNNRPKINNITLSGNKKSSDLKIAYSMTEAEYAAATKNAESIYCLQENATSFEEEYETASSHIEWSAGDPSGYVATWVYAPSNQNFTGCTAVDCDDPAITVDSFSVVEGDVQAFLSCDDTTEIGETVTFTYTLTQAAGATRIVKNDISITDMTPVIIRSGEGLNGEHSNVVFTEAPSNFRFLFAEVNTRQTSDTTNPAYTINTPLTPIHIDGSLDLFKVTMYAGYGTRVINIYGGIGDTTCHVDTSTSESNLKVDCFKIYGIR